MFVSFLVIFSVKFQHNISADRISAMKKVSYLFTYQAYDGSTSAFSVSLNNCVFSVTAAHNDCASSSCPDAVVHCDGLKIIASSTRNTLEGSQFVESRIGDDVYVRGYSDVNINNNYKASIRGTCGKYIVNDDDSPSELPLTDWWLAVSLTDYPARAAINITMSYVPSLLSKKAEPFVSNSLRNPFFMETANTLYHFL